MKLSIGIVGLPNVGKSTLFNALLKKQVADVADYPFTTINPNIGIVEVPDERLAVLSGISGISKTVPVVVEFYDIAGLVKGAHKGEGLGNMFLSHIREVAAIAHVVRMFDDSSQSDVRSIAGDIKTVETELIFADLATLDKQQQPKANSTIDEKKKWDIIINARKYMNDGIPVRKQNTTPEDRELLKPLCLLTDKNVLYVFNVAEIYLKPKERIESIIEEILKTAGEESDYCLICAKLESEIQALTDEEQKEYLTEYGLTEPGLNRLIKRAYDHLSLISFFTTVGNKEIRAWTIKKGTRAKEAAGIVHTDFEQNFIKADVISYKTLAECGSRSKAKETGKVLTVGKDYIVADGDILEFKISG